jgi:ABC-type branched-subunit amino acid transport system ATPase component
MKLLELNGVQAGYGAGPVLKGLTIEVGEGEIVALLGSNGAGKSTTLRSISGLVPNVTGASPTCRRGGASSRGSRCARISCWARPTAKA